MSAISSPPDSGLPSYAAPVNTLLASANAAALAANAVNGQAIAPASVASAGAVSGTTGTFSGNLRAGTVAQARIASTDDTQVNIDILNAANNAYRIVNFTASEFYFGIPSTTGVYLSAAGNVIAGAYTDSGERGQFAGNVKAEAFYSTSQVKAVLASATVPLFKFGSGGSRRVSGLLTLFSFNGVNTSTYQYAFCIYCGYGGGNSLSVQAFVNDGTPLFSLALTAAGGETTFVLTELGAAATNIQYKLTLFERSSGTVFTIL